jgi:hypothetical protein
LAWAPGGHNALAGLAPNCLEGALIYAGLA